MQTGARYQAVLDLLTEIWKDRQPADAIINDYLRARKYIGSKDRRFIGETVWTIIRNRMKLEFDARSQDARKVLLWFVRERLDNVFDGSTYGMAALSAEEKQWLSQDNEETYPDYVEAECPEWLFRKIKSIDLCKALNRPAAADLRVNLCTREEGQRRLCSEGITAKPMAYSPFGLRVEERFSLGNCVAFQEGLIDVQDEASQLATILCEVQPEHKIMDYCCGAGGKSLMLAHILNNQGKITAHDIHLKRLEALKPRLARLGVKNIELADFAATTDRDYDRFIIDAPCSGTGTWRRSPDGKFRLSEKMLENLNKTQREILETGALKTKPGGRLIYMTCSILPQEDEEMIDQFLVAHPEFKPVDMEQLWLKLIGTPYPHHTKRYLKMSPMSTGTDGFFIAVLERGA